MICIYVLFFFFQAEDGIRDKLVTGVQTCALPIWMISFAFSSPEHSPFTLLLAIVLITNFLVIEARRYRYFSVYRARVRMIEIGRASCREKSVDLGGRRIIKKKKNK